MSSISREYAEDVHEELEQAAYHTKRATEQAQKVKDPALHRKLGEVKEAIERADSHVQKGLER